MVESTCKVVIYKLSIIYTYHRLTSLNLVRECHNQRYFTFNVVSNLTVLVGRLSNLEIISSHGMEWEVKLNVTF